MLPTLLFRSSLLYVGTAGFPLSQPTIQKACDSEGLTLHTLDMSELAKADGALTCCSVLVVDRL